MSSQRLTLDVILKTIDKATAPLKKVMGGSKQTAKALDDARKALRRLQDQQSDISSFRDLQRSVKGSRTEFAQATAKAKQLKQALESTDNPTKRMTRDFEKAAREVEKLRDKHLRQLRALKSSKQALYEAGIDTSKLAQHNLRLSRDIDTATDAIKRQQRELDALSRRNERLAAARSNYNRAQHLAGNMAASGAGAVALGGSMMFGAKSVITPGMDFDEAMSKVQALARLDKNSPQYKALREQARALGASTSFSATDAAAGQSFLAMAGFTPESIRAAMPGMLDLAKAAGAELADTADIGSNILTGFNLKADQMGRVGDVLVGTFTRSNTNLQMLGDTMAYVAPVAAGLGSSLEETAAMAGKLGDAGIQASMAGTALRAIYSRLAAPPKMAADAIAELGLKTNDAMGNLRPVPELLQEIYKKTKDMGTAARADIFKSIAGEEAFSALQVLVDQAGSGQLQTMIKTLKDAQGEAGKTAATMADNAKGDLKGLLSAIQDVAIEVTDLNDGPLRGLIQQLTEITRSVGGWIKANPELVASITKWGAITGALVLGLGSLALVLSTLLGPFALLRWTLTALGIKGVSTIGWLGRLAKRAIPAVGRALLWLGRLLLANPIGLLITAIAAGAYLIYSNWDTLGPKFEALWELIKAKGEAFWNVFSNLPTIALDKVKQLIAEWDLVGMIKQKWDEALAFITSIPDKLHSAGEAISEGISSGITSGMKSVKDTVGGMADSVSGWFKDPLGIHSPSRVFIKHGQDLLAGLQIGLGDSQGPLSTMQGLVQRIKGMAASMLTDSGSIGLRFDSRPALQPRAASQTPVTVNLGGITINAAQGMDLEGLAQLIGQEIERRALKAASRARSALKDED